MTWNDRWHLQKSPPPGLHPERGLFLLLTVTIVAHLAKVVLVGRRVIEPNAAEELLGVSEWGLSQLHYWQLLTYQFVHDGVGHLFWNMVVLFFVGRYVESIAGTHRLIVWYLVSGMGGALGALLIGEPFRPTIGASGSIMGLLAVLMVIAPDVRLNAILFEIRLFWVGLIYVAFDLCFAFGDGRVFGPKGMAANSWSHVLGYGTGLIAAWVLPRILKPMVGRAQDRRERQQEVQVFTQEIDADRELDRILDKINREGMPSLTESERSFLKNASSRFQNAKKS